MKQKPWIVLFGMVTVALILAACGGDSGNNGTESEGNSSSSAEISSSGGQINSSSVVKSSSSSVVVSSSSVAVCTNTYGTNTVKDCRDNQTYKTVVIGTQTWMAQNLNYADSAAMPNLAGNSLCYGNSADSCAKYGRLYTWTGAMNMASSYQSELASAVISTPQQGVCPAGWHIPTDAEWTTLENAVGGSNTAGTYLKSTNGWYNDGNGTDSYGYSARPAGFRNNYGDFRSAGLIANFWSASENLASHAYNRYLNYDYAYMYTHYNNKYFAFSVRCVKDF